MADPESDDDDKPLDPAVQRVEVRIRQLFLVAALTLGVGIVAVFGGIVYRIMQTDDKPAAVAVAGNGDAAEAAVRSALAAWNASFNAGDTDAICDLFAPDLRYDYSGVPERNFDDMCGQLRRVLSDRSRSFAYALDIREVIVTGDIAVVRLVWTLTTRPPEGATVSSRETGMDLFRRQPDGSWKISRFIALDG